MTKEEVREYNKKYYQSNKKKVIAQVTEYYKANREKVLEYHADYRRANNEKIAEYNAEYYKANKEKFAKYQAEYNDTKIGRARYLIRAYRQKDKKYNRGEGDLTAKWIVDNIFTKPCAHCGETDWRKIGCNRLDNSKPHTKDNVEPCCKECNDKLGVEYRKLQGISR